MAASPSVVKLVRHLASDRATEVVIYIQERIPMELLNPGRLVALGIGQWRNVAPNETAADRAEHCVVKGYKDKAITLRNGNGVLIGRVLLKRVLLQKLILIPALTEASPYIDELKVLGHTAQAEPNKINRVVKDRHLASDRATEVVIYIQERIPESASAPAGAVPGRLQSSPVV